MSHCEARGHNFNNGAESLDIDVRCRITIKTKPYFDIIANHEQLEITIYQLVQVYKVKHLKQQLVNELSQFKCVLDDLPEPPRRLIVVTVDGKRQKKLTKTIIQLLNRFSWYCEECTITWKSFKILRDSDFLFTVIRNRGSVVDIVYCKNDYIEWSVNLEGCGEEQKFNLMSLLDKGNQTKCMLNGNEITIFTNPRNTDLILDICHNVHNGGYIMIYRGTINESHISTNICDGKDTSHGNDSEEQPILSSNTEPEPEDGHVNNNSRRHCPSSLKIKSKDMTMNNDANVPSETILDASGDTGPRSENRVVVNHLENREDTSFGGNVYQTEHIGAGTNKEDKRRLSPTSQDTMNKNWHGIKRIDLIYLKLFTKRKPILDKILHFFSQSGYNRRLSFNDDGSTEPPLNNLEFFGLNIAVNNVVDIKKLIIEQYDLPDGWVDSMNIIENNIVVEKRDPYILIVGLQNIVDRVLVNLHQYIREADVSTMDRQQIENNVAPECREYLGSYSYGISRPVDCEYICKEGDQLLRELQKRYQCFIDIQRLVTGTKEIHFANWMYDSKEAGHIQITLIIGDYRTLPDKSDMLVLDQSQTDHCYESGQKISDCLTLLKNKEGRAHYFFVSNKDSSAAKIKQDLEEFVNERGCKTLILFMDKTPEKETVSFFVKACKSLTKKIYLSMESKPQINRHLLENLFEKGTLEYGGQGHYIEMKIGQINNQRVDVIVGVVESQSLSNRYDINVNEIKGTNGVNQYRFELKIPRCSSDSSNPMINLSFLVMKCLIEASKKNVTGIAFPVLGVGSLGYPIRLVARSMMETIDEYFRCKNEASLCHVMIVIEDDDTSSKEAFFGEYLARIKGGRMTGDTVYKVDIEITGDERDKLEIETKIDDIIAKKKVIFNDISNPIREVRIAADKVDEVNKKLTGDKTERRATERDLERTAMIARQRPKIERERPTTERETKDKSRSGEVPEVVSISGTNSEASRTPSNWQKGELLGKGGFGEVYKCYDKDTGREYAVKIVQLGNLNAKDPKLKEVQALENELNLLKSFKHGRIVQYYGCQKEDKVMSIFIEYMPGGSVKDLINDIGRIEELVVRKYSRQLLQGLAYLHRNDIVHRDIKAANVLRDTLGNVKLGDFGASKQLEKLRSASRLRTFIGTSYWMAPEVIKSEGYGRKADIWSVGCTIVEMFTTKPPFHEFEAIAAIYHIGTCKHPVYELPDNVTNIGKEFVALTLQITQADRPSADDLLKDRFVKDETQ